MKHLFGYMKKHIGMIFIIVILLLVQASCDLALPGYTSDIVDVGISGSGIEHIAMEKMSLDTYKQCLTMLSQQDLKYVEQRYEIENDMAYRKDCDKKELDSMDEILAKPMAMLMYMQGGAKEQGKAKAAEMEPKVIENMDNSMLKQVAVQFARNEYKKIGVDLDKKQMNYLWSVGGRMILVTILMMICAIFVSFLAAKTGSKIGFDLRKETFQKVLSFSNHEMNKFSTASLITRSTNDINQIQMVTIMILRMVAYAPILGIGGIIKVATTNTNMDWIIIVAVLAVSAVVLVIFKVAMPKFKMMQILVDKMNQISREILTGIPVIRAFKTEKLEEERFDKANKELMETQLFTNRVMTFMMPLMTFIMSGISLLIVWFGAKGISNGDLMVGDMIAFMTYSMQIIMSFLMISAIGIFLPRAGVAANRIEEILHEDIQIKDGEVLQKEHQGKSHEIEFHDVSFSYDTASEDALEHISFVAKEGETTAILGSTGSGKSTILNLIERFYDVSQGSITIGGVDIRNIPLKDLREQIGYVPQKSVLFSGTIQSNIAFGKDKISEEEMKNYGDMAEATEFIMKKEKGFYQEISQGGSNVSGGQKQRLSIARALARESAILMFDDSFSALDYKTDGKVRRNLKRLKHKPVILIVAQRISTIMGADQIILLDEGHMIGKGTHEELLNNCKEYREIALSQLSEEELKGGVTYDRKENA